MFETSCDVAVIGGGAAGLAAAAQVARRGLSPLVFDREPHLGGILQQCIHTGFGLRRFKAELSGPEYAGRDIAEIRGLRIPSCLETTVLDVRDEGSGKALFACSSSKGAMKVKAGSVILAMGCRERNRGNLGIAGTRPSGVMTAGLAQRLANLEGCLPGRKAVVIGSGDIGLIMARRLTWIGAKVEAVIEILPYPSGLARNIAQCLDDYGIPLLLAHSATRILGRDRVEGVEVAPLTDGVPDAAKTFKIDCDCVLLSVGLIPENELSKRMGVKLSLATGGPLVDSSLMTNVPGVFACGNVLHVHDLVDNVSEEALNCGDASAEFLSKAAAAAPVEGRVDAGSNVKYVMPPKYRPGKAQRFLMRALAPFDDAELSLSSGGVALMKKRLRFVRPSEMLSVEVPPDKLPAMAPGGEAPALELSIVKREAGA